MMSCCGQRKKQSFIMLPVPRIEDRPFKKPLFCGPGPCDVWPSVQEAYSKPVISSRCDENYNVCDDIRTGFQYIFQTKSKLVLALSGSGHAGMEAIITNLVQPGETMLIAARGMWDERALEITKRHDIKAAITRVPMHTTFDLDQIECELKKVRPQALFITHGDSSTGTVQNLKGLGDLCHKYGALLLVDTVVSLVAEPFFMDKWGVDAVYTSTQKALSGPAGISAVAFSSLAELKMNSRTHEPPFYLDIKLLAQQWNCYGNTRFYHHTLSPPLIWALHACIKEVCKETLPTAWARHATTMAHFNSRVEQLSFKLMVPKSQDRLTTVTTVVLPKGYDYNEFSLKMRANHNILIFPGLGPTAGKALRIGLMGVNSTTEVADRVADAMADTLRLLMRKSLV